MKQFRPLVFGILLAAGVVQVASAAPLLSTETDVSAFNNNYGTTLSYGGAYSGNYPSASVDYQTSFTGLNSAGTSQTMTIHGTGTAQADVGVLKTSSSLTVTNPYYNSTNPIYVDSNFNVNPNGSPDLIEVYSQARFNDSLLVNAAGSVSSLNVFVHLDGSTTYSDPSVAYGGASTQTSLVVTDPSGNTCNTCGNGGFQGAGNFSQTFTLNIPVSDPNAVNLGILLYMINDFFPNGLFNDTTPATYTNTMDFSHTLTITGLQGLNSNGNVVALNSVTGSSGTIYPVVSAVPLPAGIWLFGSGLLGLAGVGGRRRC